MLLDAARNARASTSLTRLWINYVPFYTLVLRTSPSSFFFEEEGEFLFAARSLAHIWVRSDLILPPTRRGRPRPSATRWLRAALSLRPTLWHITSMRRSADLSITMQHVQAIPEQLQAQGAPTVVHSNLTRFDTCLADFTPVASIFSTSSEQPSATPSSCILSIAESIASAWNALVAEGKRNDVKCECGRC